MARVEFFGSQVGGRTIINYSYTDMPWKLVFWDVLLFVRYAGYVPWVLWPIWPYYGGRFDELSLTFQHIWCVFVHIVLAALQLAFILALPSVFILPGWLFLAGFSTFLTTNWLLCRTLNGGTIQYRSDPKYTPDSEIYENEQWIFLNGVSVGEAWLKDNLDRLALTFGRPVLGIHNRTSGVIFDILEAIIQRCFAYATSDIRLAYKILKDKLYNPQYKTVVFILHSQGGIEGGLVIDWLLQEVPQDLLAKLEVYTFGNAANHFNNPHRHLRNQEAEENRPHRWTEAPKPSSDDPSEIRAAEIKKSLGRDQSLLSYPASYGLAEPAPPSSALDRAIGHIEHYAHTADFVALWGVLHFVTDIQTSAEIPRFVGRLFASGSRGGHLLNQHYLNDMFPLARNSFGEFIGCAENNEFMDSIVDLPAQGWDHNHFQAAREDIYHSLAATNPNSDGIAMKGAGGPVRVRDLSRLWQYRNGRIPRQLRKVWRGE